MDLTDQQWRIVRRQESVNVSPGHFRRIRRAEARAQVARGEVTPLKCHGADCAVTGHWGDCPETTKQTVAKLTTLVAKTKPTPGSKRD